MLFSVKEFIFIVLNIFLSNFGNRSGCSERIVLVLSVANVLKMESFVFSPYLLGSRVCEQEMMKEASVGLSLCLHMLWVQWKKKENVDKASCGLDW